MFKRGYSSLDAGEEIQDSSKICAIITAFNPTNLFEAVLMRVVEQIKDVIVIDNSVEDSATEYTNKIINSIILGDAADGKKINMHVVHNKNNGGISRAFNIGVDYGAFLGCQFFLFLDQDSLIEKNAVNELIINYNFLIKHFKVGGISCANIEANRDIFQNLSENFYQKHYVKNYLYKRDGIKEKYFLISSGLFIPKKVVCQVGSFDEDLFLDSVDHEFCLRLLENNYHFFVIESSKIFHSLGQLTKIKIWKFEFTVSIHTPARSFYMIRDTLIMFYKHWNKKFLLSSVLLFSLILSTTLKLILLPQKGEYLRNAIGGFSSFISWNSKKRSKS